MGKKILLIACVQAVPRRKGLAAAREVQPAPHGTSAPQLGAVPWEGRGCLHPLGAGTALARQVGEGKGTKGRRNVNACTMAIHCKNMFCGIGLKGNPGRSCTDST